MDPTLIAAGIAAVSALAQEYSASQARGASKKQLNAIKAAFEAIVPPGYDISINDPPKYITQQLEGAKLDFSRLTPETYKVVATYAPQAAQFVGESRPELVKGSAAQKEGRGAQIDALRQLQAVAKGESPELKIRMQQAADQAQAQAQQRTQSSLQDAQRRGMLGSGLSFASALQGSSDAMQGGAAQSQAAAIAAYKDKLAAIQGAGQMGRQLSQDELAQEAGNTDIINSFNQRTSKNYQDYLNQRAQMQNDAQRYNIGQQQDVSNRNVGLGNETQRYNLENKNRLAQMKYQNDVGERNYQNTIAEQQANWGAREKDRQNDLRRQAYQDQMSKQSAMSGIGYQQNAQAMQSAQDRNQMIGGIAGAAAGYYGGKASAQSQKEAQDREDARWDKYYSRPADKYSSARSYDSAYGQS